MAAPTAAPTAAPIGAGAAKLAMDTVEAKKLYDQHVMDAQENGTDPLPFDEWVKQQTAAQEQAKADQAAGYNDANK